MKQTHFITNHLRRIGLPALVVAVLLVGCQPATGEQVAAVAATPLPQPTATRATTTQTLQTPPTASPQTTNIQTTDPVAVGEASPPVRLRIPAIDLDVVVSPMGWQVTEVGGARTTTWKLPAVGVGWHPDSALAGSAGNVVISGHQLLGDAPFALIALGEVTVGQEILLTDGEERTFVYLVTEVSEPLPISSTSREELALATRYTAQGNDPLLTLITGWPDFSSTHRLFVVADFQGVRQ